MGLNLIKCFSCTREDNHEVILSFMNMVQSLLLTLNLWICGFVIPKPTLAAPLGSFADVCRPARTRSSLRHVLSAEVQGADTCSFPLSLRDDRRGAGGDRAVREAQAPGPVGQARIPAPAHFPQGLRLQPPTQYYR